MKIWQAALLTISLAILPVLSACDALGLGNSQQEQQEEYYRQQIEAYNKAQEINRQQTEAYNKALQEGLEDWAKAYNEWQQQKLQQMENLEGMPTDNQN